MSYEEILERAKALSDHNERVQEIEPAVVDAIKNTNNDSCVIEIGNREGGSAILIMFYSIGRKFYTCDEQECPKSIFEWAGKLGIQHEHFKMPEDDFVTNHLPEKIGFIYFDADHQMEAVTQHVSLTVPKLVKNAIVAIDDVQEWKSLPEFDGMERVNFQVDQGGPWGGHGLHILFLRKL